MLRPVVLAFLLVACKTDAPTPSSGGSAAPAAPVAPPAPSVPPAPSQEQLRAERAAAIAERDQATQATARAASELEALSRDLSTLEEKLTAAIEALANATSDTERAAAQTRLDTLRKEHEALTAKITDAKTAFGAKPRK